MLAYQQAEYVFRDQSSSSDLQKKWLFYDPVQVASAFCTLTLEFLKLGSEHLLCQTASWGTKETIYFMALYKTHSSKQAKHIISNKDHQTLPTSQILSATCFVNKILLEYSHIHPFIYFYGLFSVRWAELSHCNRDLIKYTAPKIFITFCIFQNKFAGYWQCSCYTRFYECRRVGPMSLVKMGKGLKGVNSGREPRNSRGIFVRYA